MPTDKKALSPRREQYCQEFIKDHNATQAAIRAGYNAKWATSNGHRLSTYDSVKARIAELEEQLRLKHEDIIERNIELLYEVAHGDHVDTSKGMPELRHNIDGRVVQAIEPGAHGTKYKLYDRLRAADMLNKMMGAYTEHVDVTSKGDSIHAPLQIVFEEVTRKKDAE